MRFKGKIICIAAALGCGALAPSSAFVAGSGAALAQDTGNLSQSGFEAYLDQVRARALAQGVSRRTIDSAFAGLTYNPRVVELDQSQPGGTSTHAPSAIPDFAPYRAKHVSASLIQRGRSAYARERGNLMRIEEETGVPESIMVAIWGQETNYGGYTGDFDLVRSLATLAYEGRRRPLFEHELIATLKLMDKGIPRSQLVGSWAGATGYPQFLPSVYLRLARDGNGDGKADIWRSPADALASIANYLVNAGWKAGEPWGVPVRAPSSLNREAIATELVSPRCARVHARHSRWLTMREWRALGVQQLDSQPVSDDALATLIEPDGPNATAYLTFGNYNAILDYNCSNFYALSVGLLADAVKG